MKRLIKRLSYTLMCLCGTAVGITPASAQNLYGISFFGNEIIEINQETGLAMSVAKLNEPIYPYGIAVHEGKLYSFEPATDQLVALDLHTGMTSARFDLGISDTQGEGDLAFRSDGVGFLASALDDEGNPVNELYSFDLASGTSTLVGNTEWAIDALAFDGDDTLYALGQGEGALFTVDPNTAEMTSVGSLSVPQNSPFAAMTFSPEGILYAVIDDRLHIIDTMSGTAQPVDEDTLDLNFSSVSGLAFFDPPMQSQILVSSMEDVVDPEDGQVSLREAIMMANDTPGEDIIVLPEGTFTLSLAGDDEDSNMNGDLVLMDDAIIWGAGKENTIIDAGGMEGLNNRVLYVANDTSVSLHQLTITGGVAENGGGIYNDGGKLYLSDVCVINNIANGEAGSGGGIYNNTGGKLNILDSEIRENQANRAGGGIEDNAGEMGSVVLRDVNLDANNAGVEPAMAAPGSGGGFHMTGPGNATFISGSVNANMAATEGGGLWNGSGTMIVEGVTVDGNTASGDAAHDGGGGVFNAGGMVMIRDMSVISNNVADGTAGSGGGIFNNAGGSVEVMESMITGNIANRAGGGIEDNSGAMGGLTLTDVNLDNNNTGVTPAIASPGNGGGLHITGPGDATISGGTANGNVAAAEGGGLWNGSGTMVVDGTMIDGNFAHGNFNPANGTVADLQGGGGIFNNGGTLRLANATGPVTVQNNQATGAMFGSGGGIFSSDGEITIAGAIITSNEAVRAGGGIELIEGMVTITNGTLNGNDVSAADLLGAGLAASPGNGGAIHITGAANITIEGGTVNNNRAGREGGGLWNGSGVMTVLNGTIINGNIANGPAADDGGGGLFNNAGTIILNGANAPIWVTNNMADGAAGSGGGIFNNVGCTLMATDAHITGNIANRAGGGVEDNAGAMMMFREIILAENVAGPEGTAMPGNGGGIHVTGPGTVEIERSTIHENHAANEGGGLWNSSPGIMSVEASTISHNTAPDGGGFFAQPGDGLGLSTLVNSTISGNTGANGAGVQVEGTTVSLLNCTIGANTATVQGGGINQVGGSVESINTIIALNSAPTGPDFSGALSMAHSTLLQNPEGASGIIDGENGNIVGVDPQLDSLSDNGGPTLTHLPSALSPVIDAGDEAAAALLASDQRGLSRSSDGNADNVDVVDIGAVERQNGERQIAVSSMDDVVDPADGQVTLREAISMANDTPGEDIIVLPEGTFSLSLAGDDENSNTNGDLSLMDDTILWGAGKNETIIDAGGMEGLHNRVLYVANGVTVNLHELTLTGGVAEDGGGIYNDGGVLTLHDVCVIGNIANGAAGSGGGIYNNTGGKLTVIDSEIVENQANRAGGGIEDNGGETGDVTLISSHLDHNNAGIEPAVAAPGSGGGFHMTGPGNATFKDTSANHNLAAAEGGGLWNGTGMMTIDRSIIEGNIASGDGADQGGGGVFNAGGTITILNQSIIANNIADGTAGSGGGILNDVGGNVNITDALILKNTSNRAGGGIEDNAGADGGLTLTGVNLDWNNVGMEPAVAAPGNGGGLHITGPGNVTITRGTNNDNKAAAEGGGLWNGTGMMILDKTTVDSNIASGNAADQGGGGVFNAGGSVVIRNMSVISNNIADGTAGSGGGILSDVGGILHVTDSTIVGNRSNRAGGGIEDNSGADGELILTDVTLDNNNTGMAPAIASPGNGGGLHITGPGNATIAGGTANGNIAAAEGGGLWNGSGPMTINGTIIDSNVASGDGADQGGGGVFNAGGMLTIQNLSVITNNVANGMAGSGGGILNDAGGSLVVTDSTITMNISNRAGGGIEDNSGEMGNLVLTNVNLDDNNTGVAPAVASPGNGGGLHITGPGNATMTGGTANGNIAAAEGGGLWNGTGPMVIDGTTIHENTASGDAADQGGGGIFNAGGMVTVINSSIISNNMADGASGSGGGILNDAGGTVDVTSSLITRNVANRAGGGIEDNSGEMGGLILTDVNLDFNNTGVAPAVASPGNGGGLHITGPGNATITGGWANGNVAAREGGGLWNGSGIMTVTGTNVHGNVAHGDAADDGGGGIFNNGGTLVVNDSMISANIAEGMAGSGGGVFSTAGSVSITNTTIMSNIANRAGGGIELINGELTLTAVTLGGSGAEDGNVAGPMGTASPGNGGGIHITGIANTVIDGGVVWNNHAAREGGGLWNQANSLMTIRNGTVIDGNSASGPASDDGGGGIFNNGGAVVVDGTASVVMLSNNTADGENARGSGILSVGGTVSLDATTIDSDVALIQMAALSGEAMIAGNLSVDGGSMLSPGFSGGVIESGNATLMGGSHFHVELGGTMPGPDGYDQLRVMGMVDLNGVTLSAMALSGAMPSIGDAFVIIDNDGADAVNGTFMNLPEGAIIYVGGMTANVSYTGGDGNDVVITLQESDAYSDFLTANFDPEDLNDPDKEETVYGVNADPDRDGKANAFEFIEGSDPNSYDLDPFVMLENVEVGANTFATYSIMRMMGNGDGMIELHVSDMSDANYMPTSKEPMTMPEGDEHEWLTFEDDVAVTNDMPRFGKVVVTIGGTMAESEVFGISSMPVKPHTAETVGTLTFAALRFVEQSNGHGEVTATEMDSLTDELANWPEDLATSEARYVMITSGPNAGVMADIVSNTSDTLTLSDDLSAFSIVGESYEIRPHTTIGWLFGLNNEAGLASGANSTEADNILLVYPGGEQQTIFFSEMDGAWWDGDFEAAENVIIAPEQGFVIRRKQSDALNLLQQGAILIGPKVAPIEQDFNLVGTIKASKHLMLDELGLYTGDPETGLAGGLNPLDADNIMVINPDGSTSLYFPFVNGEVAGWRDAAYDPAGEVMIPAGTSFYVRRRPENGNAFNWVIPAE